MRDHAAAARQPRPHQARGGPLSRRLRFLSRRARHSRQSDRAPHAALAARSHDIDAAVEGRRAVLDRPARHQIHGHAGLGGAGARRRDLGRRGLPETNSDHRCGELSRARARRRSHTRPDRREARHRRIQPAGCRRVRALPWRRGQRAGQCAGAGPPRPACRVPDDGACSSTPKARAAAASCSRWRPIWERRTSGGWRSTTRSSRRPRRRPAPPTAHRLERGRRLATEGDPANGIPACNACHGRDALASYPRLAGQNAAYMAGQLRLWKAGHHTSTGGAAIMAPDRTAFERRRHRCGDRLSFRSRRRTRRGIAAMTGRRALAVCTGRRGLARRLRRQPVRPQSERPRSPSACAPELAAVRVRDGRAPARRPRHGRGDPRTAAAARSAGFRPHGRLGRHRLPGGHPDRPSGLRRVADACEHRRSR